MLCLMGGAGSSMFQRIGIHQCHQFSLGPSTEGFPNDPGRLTEGGWKGTADFEVMNVFFCVSMFLIQCKGYVKCG